jgi:hypothetical protein
MYAVSFFEKKNLLLSQLLRRVPVEGENLTIKGRKGKVAAVSTEDGRKFQVQLVLEAVQKKQAFVDPSKKKKR